MNSFPSTSTPTTSSHYPTRSDKPGNPGQGSEETAPSSSGVPAGFGQGTKGLRQQLLSEARQKDTTAAEGSKGPEHTVNKATQTEANIELSYESLQNTVCLGKLPWDKWKKIQRDQHEGNAQHFMDKSAVTIPAALAEGSTWRASPGHPMDMRLYVCPDTGKVRAGKLEDNTFGWAGPIAGPKVALTEISHTLREHGANLHAFHPSPLGIVGSSGRMKIDPKSGKPRDNTNMGETIWKADQVANGLRQKRGEDAVDVIPFEPDDFADDYEKQGFKDNGRATVLIGYSQQLNAGENFAVREGQAYFRGRPVQYILNERLVAYIEAKHGKIDPTKTMIGAMADLGTDKFKAYTAHNKYVESQGAVDSFLCNRPILAYLSHDRAEVIENVQKLLNQGKDGILKPDRTGSGHGIIDVRQKDNNPDAIGKIFDKSIAEVDQRYNYDGGKNAGLPYTVAEFLPGVTIKVPDDLKAKYGKLEGCGAEIRIGVFGRKQTDEDGNETHQVVACPFIVKVQTKGSIVANTGGQEETTGLSADELVLPATNPDVIRLLGLDIDKMTDISRFCADYSYKARLDIHDANVAAGKG